MTLYIKKLSANIKIFQEISMSKNEFLLCLFELGTECLHKENLKYIFYHRDKSSKTREIPQSRIYTLYSKPRGK